MTVVEIRSHQQITVRTPFFKEWFGDWEKEVERRAAGHVTGDSAPFTPALSPTLARVSHPYSKDTAEPGKSKAGLLDKKGEPFIVHRLS